MMLAEKDFEDIICKYSDLIEAGLTLKGRQLTLYGRRIDILFEDKFKRKLIIELKVGPIKDEHIGQILSYEGMLLSSDDPSIRVMLVGNRVPPNIQKSLDHHGIAWKEISFSKLKEYLVEKNDAIFLGLFDTEEFSHKLETTRIKEATSANYSASDKGSPKLEIPKKKKTIEINYSALGRIPALFIPIQGKWIKQAFDDFSKGKEKITFYTGSNIGEAANLGIKTVYFKVKGDREITAKADFISLSDKYPAGEQLAGENMGVGKYYYTYNNLEWLESPVSIIDLKYFKSDNNLRTDVPGACIILDPFADENVMQENGKGALKVKAVDLIQSFRSYVLSNPNNKHNKYLTFDKTEKMIEPLGDMLWDEVEHNQDKITEKIKQYWGGINEPALRSIELAWMGLAFCYEYGVVKGMISKNPFRHMLPRNTETGSLID